MQDLTDPSPRVRVIVRPNTTLQELHVGNYHADYNLRGLRTSWRAPPSIQLEAHAGLTANVVTFSSVLGQVSILIW